ncbi:MAG: cation:proton antiporter [Bacteroidetes bacterium]|nr:cation:proton antiporter [Bacteroidota bacterium]MDA0903884.1 cation:proton antiporter [Bacteroidota bacterium]MDA1243183.1 cation:proton antiporter [Bacteroidota bacterium]
MNLLSLHLALLNMLDLGVEHINAYGLVIGGSTVIILSYFANLLARRTNIPSVLVLIAMGIAIRQGFNAVGLTDIPFESLVLELLGTVGLIFIVLEAALELELSKAKLPLILKSAALALAALVLSTGAIALLLHHLMDMPWLNAAVYGIPLSIMSSAIIIPSVGGLAREPREFMVYESTFSDIFGIMAFYLLLGNQEAASGGEVVLNIVYNLVGTLVISVVVAYLMVFVLQKIESGVRLFLSIAVLLLIYAIQKLLHLSPLVLILIFGLMLNNHKLFFPNWLGVTKGWPGNLLRDDRMKALHHDFHVLTLESAFVIRTFFFVIFGMTVSLAAVTDIEVVFFGLVICLLLYGVRLALLLSMGKRPVAPLLYIAPRGLITILLFFALESQHPELVWPGFDQGILLVVILATSLVMTAALIQSGGGIQPVADHELEVLPSVHDGGGQVERPEALGGQQTLGGSET